MQRSPLATTPSRRFPEARRPAAKLVPTARPGTRTPAWIPRHSGRDNLITTAEGQPAYGPIQVSLTTRGDTSPASALAVSRFPVANSVGFLRYERTFSVPSSVASNLGKKAIVQHGVDLNHNGRYDFRSAGRSELDPSLPQEATIPANCGVINPVG